MGQQEVQNVLNTLMFKQQQNLAQQKQAQEQTQNEAENKLKQQQIQDVQNQLAEQQRQFNITHKATAALNDLEMQQREQNLVGGIKQGLPVPGETEISRRPVQIATDPDTNQPVMGEMVLHQLPSGHQVELPSQETLNKQNYYQVELPKIKAQERAKEQEIEQTKQADFGRFQMQKGIDLDRTQLTQDAEDRRNAATNKTRLAVAAMKGGQTYDVTPYINGGIEGDYTVDDIKKFLPKTDAITALNSLASQGFRPVTKQQQDFLSQLKGNADLIPKMDQFIGALPDTTSMAGGVTAGIGSMFDSGLKNLENEIQGRAMPLARSIGMDKGNIPLKLLDKTISGYIPSRYTPKAQNIIRRNDFANDLDKMIDSHLANLSPQQRLLIKKKYGLDKLTTPYGGQVSNVPNDPAAVFQKFGVAPTGR